MKTDVHVHCPGVAPSERSARALKAHLVRQGISKAILMSSGEDTRQLSMVGTNEEVAQIANSDPSFYSWMCNIDPKAPETVYDRLACWKARGAVGVGELVINRWLDDDFLQKVFAAAEKLELPVTLHMSSRPGFLYGVCDRPGLLLLEQVLQTFPRLTVVGHSALFWLEISGDCPREGDMERNSYGSGPVTPNGTVPRLLDRYPNLYCDLSATSGSTAIMRDEDYGRSFLERYQDRLLFATDSFDCRKIFPLGDFLDRNLAEGKLSSGAYDKICWQNANRIYRL